MDIQSVTNAMFSILEYARILLGLVWIMDSIAPQRADTADRRRRTSATPLRSEPVPIYPNTLLKRSRTATLEQTVERIMVVWVGDSPYISGIHAWNGTVPSFDPNPMKSMRTMMDDTV